MKNFIEAYNLQPGDRIITPLFQTGLSKHHVIYMGDNHLGMPLFAENRIFKGVQIVDANELLTTVKSIDRIIKFEGNIYQRNNALEKAYNLVGKEYNLITYNCEHFANEIQTGVASSSQVNNALLIIGGFLLTHYSLKNE